MKFAISSSPSLAIR